MSIALGFLVACASVFPASALLAADEDNLKISIQVPPGAPLRVYLTRRLPKRLGAPVEAKVMEPVFAFDREVVPAGTVAQGAVSRVRPAGRWQRVRAILNGDFTPLRSAEVEFTSLTLPEGRTLATHTVQAPAMNSIYTEPPKNPKNPKRQKSQPQNQNGGILGTVKQTAKDQVNGAINARTRGIADIVRAPNKKEKLVDLFWSKLPYHPQYYRRGTRFDAPLRTPSNSASPASGPPISRHPDRSRAPIAWPACACSLHWIRPRRSRASRSRPWWGHLCFLPSTSWCFPRAPNSPALWSWPGKHDPSIAPASFDSTDRKSVV